MSVARPLAQPRLEATSLRRPGPRNRSTIVARPARFVRTGGWPARRTVALATQRASLERSLTWMRTRRPARTRLGLSEARTLFTPLRRELDEANALFLARPTGDLVTDARASLEAVARFFVGRDGALVRALHEASAYDEEAARVWHEFNEPVIAALTDQMRREVTAGGLGQGVDVEATVRALVGMNLSCFFDQVVGNPAADVEAVAETLLTVWVRTFLLVDPSER